MHPLCESQLEPPSRDPPDVTVRRVVPFSACVLGGLRMEYVVVVSDSLEEGAPIYVRVYNLGGILTCEFPLTLWGPEFRGMSGTSPDVFHLVKLLNQSTLSALVVGRGGSTRYHNDWDYETLTVAVFEFKGELTNETVMPLFEQQLHVPLPTEMSRFYSHPAKVHLFKDRTNRLHLVYFVKIRLFHGGEDESTHIDTHVQHFAQEEAGGEMRSRRSWRGFALDTRYFDDDEDKLAVSQTGFVVYVKLRLEYWLVQVVEDERDDLVVLVSNLLTGNEVRRVPLTQDEVRRFRNNEPYSRVTFHEVTSPRGHHRSGVGALHRGEYLIVHGKRLVRVLEEPDILSVVTWDRVFPPRAQALLRFVDVFDVWDSQWLDLSLKKPVVLNTLHGNGSRGLVTRVEGDFVRLEDPLFDSSEFPRTMTFRMTYVHVV